MEAFSAGYALLKTEDSKRGRPILVDVWYPAPTTVAETPHDYGFGRGNIARDAAAAEGAHPVLLLSHGAFGAARNYSWIAEHLARVGYLVAGVSHFGESYVYGQETIAPAYALQPWLRAQDCSFVLDHLTGHSYFAHGIDTARIGALGHSSGGATVLALGGAMYDPAAMHRYCTSDAARSDKGCAYARGLPLSAIPVAARNSYRDARVRAIAALDPALGPGHDANGLSRISVPVHVVGSVDNDFLPFDAHAGRYARWIPGASSTQLTHGEGHFVYLDPCDSEREAHGVSLCRDRPGVDRAAVHVRLRTILAGFFDRHLGR